MSCTTGGGQVSLYRRLHVPDEWLADPMRRAQANVPEDVSFLRLAGTSSPGDPPHSVVRAFADPASEPRRLTRVARLEHGHFTPGGVVSFASEWDRPLPSFGVLLRRT